MTDELRAAVAGARDELIEILTPRSSGGDGSAIVAGPRGSPAPLSQQQLRLWEMIESGEPVWNRPLAARIEGDLDPDAVERGLRSLVRRHDILRTTFERIDGVVMQVVGDVPDRLLTVVEAEAEAAAGEDHALDAVTRSAVEHRFDTGHGPLLDARLLRLSARDHALVLTLHPLLWDGHSRRILVDELVVLTLGAMAGGEHALPPLALQYSDYARFQQEWLTRSEPAELLARCQAAMAGAPPSPRLRGARGPRSEPAGATHPFVVAPDLVAAIHALSGDAGVTAYTVCLAAFGLALSAETAQVDVVLGAPLANRRRAGTRELIGPFVNFVPLRLDLAGDPTFRQLLTRARSTLDHATTWQELPTRLVDAALAPGGRPPFQVSFDFYEETAALLDAPDVGVTPIVVDTSRADFDLTLSLDRRQGAVHGALIHATDVYDSATARRFTDAYLDILRTAVAAPDQPISRLGRATSTGSSDDR